MRTPLRSLIVVVAIFCLTSCEREKPAGWQYFGGRMEKIFMDDEVKRREVYIALDAHGAYVLDDSRFVFQEKIINLHTMGMYAWEYWGEGVFALRLSQNSPDNQRKYFEEMKRCFGAVPSATSAEDVYFTGKFDLYVHLRPYPNTLLEPQANLFGPEAITMLIDRETALSYRHGKPLRQTTERAENDQ